MGYRSPPTAWSARAPTAAAPLRETLRTAMDRRPSFSISGAALSALAADKAAGPATSLAEAHNGKLFGEDFVAFLTRRRGRCLPRSPR